VRHGFQTLPIGVQTLILVGVGLLIAAPYWVYLIYVRRQARVLEQDAKIFDETEPEVLGGLPWHENALVRMFLFVSLLFTALRGFALARNSVWFYALNVYYLAVIGLFAHKALSRGEFEAQRKLSPSLDRTTWVLRWIPLFVVLPVVGWLVNSLPIIRSR
jgi:hypothetical protein